MKLILLGSGTSHGVPVVGCGCPVCRSPDPRDKRMRSSLYILGAGGERVVIDTGPEFRLQAVRAEITKLDAILLTHAHADHTHGLDDVRPLSKEKPVPVYGNRKTIKEVRERFSYIFRKTQKGGGKPRIQFRPVREPVRIGGLVCTPLPVKHGVLDILGWLITEGPASDHAAVYLTDTSAVPAAARALIKRPQALIIGGLRRRPHETHFTFGQALGAAAELGARRVWLTHICHEHSHREIEDYCRNFMKNSPVPEKDSPPVLSMAPGFDGLTISV